MKKLSIILIFLVSFFSAFSQGTPSLQQRTNGQTTPADPNLFTLRSFKVPVFADTAHANTSWPTLDSAGKVIYTLDTRNYWIRQIPPRQWKKIPNSGEVVDSITVSGSTIGIWKGGMVEYKVITTGGGGTSTGVDSVTATTSEICQWSGGIPTCYPLLGPGIDSVTLTNDTTLCQWSNGSSSCYTIHGNVVQTGIIDSITRNGSLFCWWSGGVSNCITIENISQSWDAVNFSPDSSQYYFYKNGIVTDSVPTFLRQVLSRDSCINIIDSTDGKTYFYLNPNCYTTSIPALPDALISITDINLNDTTVTLIPPIIFRADNVVYSHPTPSVFEINKAPAGYLRRDLIYRDSLDVIRLIEGVEDTAVALVPAMPPHGIQVTIIDISGADVSQPFPSISTNYWSPNGNNISSGTAYLGTLNSKTLDFIIAGLIRASLDTIGQMRFYLVNNGNYPHALTFYNNLDATLPSFNLAVNSSYGEISLSANNTGYLNALRIKKANGTDSIVGGAYSDMVLQDYGKLTYKSTSSQNISFEVYSNTTPQMTLGTISRPGNRFGDSTNHGGGLEVNYTDRGFLPPRVTGAQMNAITALSNGLVVYNTDSLALCYYNGIAWRKIGISTGSGGGWSLTGNAGTDPTINFGGTVDNVPYYLRVNNDTVAKFGTLLGNTSIGYNSIASGYTSIAIGDNLQSSGNISFSSGSYSVASGDISTAIGNTDSAVNFATIAIGLANKASGYASAVIGNASYSNGDYSISLGSTNYTQSTNSAALGSGLRSKSYSGVVVGHFNDSSDATDPTSFNLLNRAFEVGIGSSNETRANGMTILFNGNVGLGTNTPDSTLHLVGGLKLDLPTKGAGKVLTSDANGAATWQTPSGSGISTAQLTDSLNARGATYLQVNNPSATGSFTLTSTTGGITNSRVTTTQMNAISSPVAGTQVYNTDYASLMEYSTEWGWTSDNTDWKIRNMIDYSNDFTGPLGNGTASLSDGMLTTSVGNGGVVDTGQAVTVNRIGLVKLSTGTNASGQARIATGISTTLQTMLLGGGRIVFETSVNPYILPSAAERYSILSGFSSTNNSVFVSNGVLFVYDSSGVVAGSTASPNWQVCTDSANTRTFSNTGVAVTANTWYNLKIIVNAAGTSVDFYINDALVKTETRTIPITPVGMMTQIFKGGGTTARTLHVDYIRYKQKFTTSR